MSNWKKYFGILLVAALVMGGCSKKDETAAPAAAEAEAVKTVVVATDATWPPMEMVDADKNIVGFDVDFIKAVAEEAGFKVEVKNTAWDGIFAGVETDKYDAIISSVTITDERKEKYDFTLPYINVGQILTVPNELAEAGVKTVADMQGKKIGAQIGTTGAIEIKKVEGVELKSYDEVGLAFEDMASGRIDGVVCDTPTAASFALQREEYKAKFKIVGDPFTEEFYGIVVKKGNTELVDLLNAGIKGVQAKGLDKEFETKWLR